LNQNPIFEMAYSVWDAATGGKMKAEKRNYDMSLKSLILLVRPLNTFY